MLLPLQQGDTAPHNAPGKVAVWVQSALHLGASHLGTSAMLSSIAHRPLQDPCNCLSPTSLCLFLFMCPWCNASSLGRHEEANIPPLAINDRLKRWFLLRQSLKGSCITEKPTSARVTAHESFVARAPPCTSWRQFYWRAPSPSTSAFVSLPSGGAYKRGSSYNFPVSCVSLPLLFAAPHPTHKRGFPVLRT